MSLKNVKRNWAEYLIDIWSIWQIDQFVHIENLWNLLLENT